MNQPNPCVQLTHIRKTYQTGGITFTALDIPSLTIAQGDFAAIVGKSGSGKSTLLNLIAGIDCPTQGEVSVGGKAIHNLDQEQIAIWRGNTLGVVFQFFQLLPTMTILENVMLPMDFCDRYPRAERKAQAMHLLERVGIAEQARKLPSSLSGGQQQRAAIARALANDPALLVADEPTGNLDSQTGDAIMELFVQLQKQGKTIIMVTHERDITRWVTTTIPLVDGRISSLPVPRIAESG
jgi:putative ABC transport system ATP-binding protein